MYIIGIIDVHEDSNEICGMYVAYAQMIIIIIIIVEHSLYY